jgi:hypothetical protein
MGLRYARVENKERFKELSRSFLEKDEAPMMIEVTVLAEDEVEAARLMASIDSETASRKGVADAAKKLVPKGLKTALRNVLA